MSTNKYLKKNRGKKLNIADNLDAFIQHHFYGVELMRAQQATYNRYIDIIAMLEKGYANSVIERKICMGAEGRYEECSPSNARNHIRNAFNLFGNKDEAEKHIKRRLAIERYKLYAQKAEEDAKKGYITYEYAWEIRLKCFSMADKLEGLYEVEKESLPADAFDPRFFTMLPSTNKEVLSRIMQEQAEDADIQEEEETDGDD